MFGSKKKPDKRSRVSSERKKELAQPGAIYIITCVASNLYCEDHSEGCLRGFFSLYLQAIYGIAFAQKQRIPHYVDFGNARYFYSDETRFNGDKNFWNYYFKQDYDIKSFPRPIENGLFENYPLQIWSRHLFREVHKVHTSIKLQDEIQAFLNEKTIPLKNKNVLGVHIRRTDHYLELSPVSISRYLTLIDRYIADYENLFVATDDKDVITLLTSRYPDKILFNDVTRSSGKQAVHFNQEFTNRFQLGLDALLDCYSLSLCARVILSPSNFSLSVLIFNPEIKYTLVGNLDAWWKRWKTLIVFYLDRWNIRKW